MTWPGRDEWDRPWKYSFWWADDPDNPRPDAWCSECEAKVQETNGEWCDESEAFAGVKLLCGACYDSAKEINLGPNK
jgi:hypothetical protein